MSLIDFLLGRTAITMSIHDRKPPTEASYLDLDWKTPNFPWNTLPSPCSKTCSLSRFKVALLHITNYGNWDYYLIIAVLGDTGYGIYCVD